MVVKHYSVGVLHTASFKTLNQARAFLTARWNGLPVDSGRTQIECGAAIYDRHESRERLSTLGASRERGSRPESPIAYRRLRAYSAGSFKRILARSCEAGEGSQKVATK